LVSWWGDTPLFHHHPKNETTNPTNGVTPKTPTTKNPPHWKAGRGSLIFDVMGFPALMMPWGG